VIRLQVLSVSHHSSSTVNTVVTVYPATPDKEGRYIGEKLSRQGGEWEEVQLRVELEERPTIQVANFIGNAFIDGPGMVTKLIINDPTLFGTFKIGDIVPLIPIQETPAGSKDN
jgi:hypothetical protein